MQEFEESEFLPSLNPKTHKTSKDKGLKSSQVVVQKQLENEFKRTRLNGLYKQLQVLNKKTSGIRPP